MRAPLFVDERIALDKSRVNYWSNSGRGGGNGVPAPPIGIVFHDFPSIVCDGVRVYPDADSNNCGGCGTSCGPSATCCSGNCVPINSNCGSCGNSCGTNQICVNDNGELICIDFLTDPYHCGVGNNKCLTFGTHEILNCCDQGVCVNKSGQFQTSNTSCGSCNNNCLDPNLYPPVPGFKNPSWSCSNGHCCPPCHAWFPGFRHSDNLYADLAEVFGGIFGGAPGAGLGSLARDYINDRLDKYVAPGCLSCDDMAQRTGANWQCCGGACVNRDIDLKNCGQCGVQCGSLQTCTDGQCVCSSSKFPNVCGRDHCANFKTGLDDLNNPDFCGGCGPSHFWDPLVECCVSGKIISIDSQNDSNNCGGCSPLAGGRCPAGTQCCKGKCISIFDRNNCGICNNSCDMEETCCGNNGCVDLQYSDDNCSACGHDCSLSGGFSSNGVWQTSCCKGMCVDKMSDSNNCKFCGRVCPPGKTCLEGECQSGPAL
jgi:Stigma-specific protein, Stig1